MDSSFIELVLASVDVLVGFLTEVEAQLNGIGPGRPIHVLGTAPHPLLSKLLATSPHLDPQAPIAAPEPETPPASFDRITTHRVGDRIPVCAVRLETALEITSRIRLALPKEGPAMESPPDTATTRWLSDQFRQLDELLQSLLWVPTEHLFDRMQRVVRDAAAKVGKPVRLTTRGGETLLDRRWEKILENA